MSRIPHEIVLIYVLFSSELAWYFFFICTNFKNDLMIVNAIENLFHTVAFRLVLNLLQNNVHHKIYRFPPPHKLLFWYVTWCYRFLYSVVKIAKNILTYQNRGFWDSKILWYIFFTINLKLIEIVTFTMSENRF